MVFQAPFLHSLRLPDSPPGAAAHGIAAAVALPSVSHTRGPIKSKRFLKWNRGDLSDDDHGGEKGDDPWNPWEHEYTEIFRDSEIW